MNKSFIFYLAFFAISLGSFGVLDNLRQRNVELLELAMIVAALVCMQRRRDLYAGALLATAALAKLLPFIFFPYLLVKKRWKAAAGFLLISIIIVIATSVTLGWDRYQLFSKGIASSHGMITLEKLSGSKYLCEISQTRGSLYTFFLSFFAKIDMGTYVPVVSYTTDNFFIPNAVFFIVLTVITSLTFWSFYKTGSRGNYFLEFSIISVLMLLVSPRTNPHYYVFTLPGFLNILCIIHDRFKEYNIDLNRQRIIIGLYFASLLSCGNLIPFYVYDKLLPLKNVAYHYFSTYSLFGIGALILWTLLIYIYRNRCLLPLRKGLPAGYTGT